MQELPKVNRGLVVIVGSATSGKTTLANSLKADVVYHTDDWIAHGHESSLIALSRRLTQEKRNLVVVEGILCYRILLHRMVLPTLVIECHAPKEIRYERLKKRGHNAKQVEGTLQMDSHWDRLWAGWKRNNKLINVIQYCSHV